MESWNLICSSWNCNVGQFSENVKLTCIQLDPDINKNWLFFLCWKLFGNVSARFLIILQWKLRPIKVVPEISYIDNILYVFFF